MDARSEPSQREGQISTSNEARLQLLIDTGLRLAGERDLDVIVDRALDAGIRLTNASFGAMIYYVISEDGSAFPLRRTVGIAGESAIFPVPDPRSLFESIGNVMPVHSVVNRAVQDLKDFAGIPLDHVSLGSYVATAVISPEGETLGAILLGGEASNAFHASVDELLGTLAAQTAAAIGNARLAQGLQREIAFADAARALQHETASQHAETARRFRQALDAGQLGTWSWDRETDLLDLDERAAMIFGAEPHLPVTRTSLRERIVVSDDLPLTPANLNEMLESNEAYRSEYRIDTKSGQRWVSSRGLPTLSADGNTVTGMTGTVQDITAQKTQETTLRQTEKLAATGRMAATIAHEINNPLEAVTNLIYLSKTDPGVPSSIQHLLELADTELARVSQIAQQTLGFYRDTSHPVDIDLSGLLHGVADLFSRKLHSRNLKIDLDVHENLHIFGLQGEVRQVFSNLVVNAIDASTKGRIRVRARPRSLLGVNGVAVVICDEGGGIPHPIRHKLFTPFFTTKQSIGTGLGLWVTRGIVEKSGGRVRFRSRTDPPTGTVFQVFLPSAKNEDNISSPLKTTILQ